MLTFRARGEGPLQRRGQRRRRRLRGALYIRDEPAPEPVPARREAGPGEGARGAGLATAPTAFTARQRPVPEPCPALPSAPRDREHRLGRALPPCRAGRALTRAQRELAPVRARPPAALSPDRMLHRVSK